MLYFFFYGWENILYKKTYEGKESIKKKKNIYSKQTIHSIVGFLIHNQLKIIKKSITTQLKYWNTSAENVQGIHGFIDLCCFEFVFLHNFIHFTSTGMKSVSLEPYGPAGDWDRLSCDWIYYGTLCNDINY